MIKTLVQKIRVGAALALVSSLGWA